MNSMDLRRSDITSSISGKVKLPEAVEFKDSLISPTFSKRFVAGTTVSYTTYYPESGGVKLLLRRVSPLGDATLRASLYFESQQAMDHAGWILQS